MKEKTMSDQQQEQVQEVNQEQPQVPSVSVKVNVLKAMIEFIIERPGKESFNVMQLMMAEGLLSSNNKK